MAFNFRHLEAVTAIRRTRSFSAAAHEINLTQSALTQAIAGLERRAGRRLFDRSPRGTRPTDAGILLADSIERALHVLNSAGRGALSPAPLRGTLSRRATGAQLLALAAVERAGGFRGGARATGLTEASIHRAVRDLEASLGVELIVTAGNSVSSTPAAVAIARATRQAMAELDRAFSALRQDVGCQVVVGAMPLVRAGLLPSAIGQLYRRDASARVHIVEGAYASLLIGLLDGRLDLLLGALRETPPDGVVQHALFQDDMVVVARSDHPLARSTGWSAAALADHPWAASPPGTPRRTRWEELMRAGGVEPPTPRVECSSASAVRGLLLQGDWLAMLSPDQFRIERELGLLTPLGGPLPSSSRPIGITMRQGWIPDAIQATFLDSLHRCASGQVGKCQNRPGSCAPSSSCLAGSIRPTRARDEAC